LAGVSPWKPRDQWDEPHETKIFGRKPVIFAADAEELLIAVILADGRNQDPVRREPIDDGRPQLIQNGKRLTQAPIIAKPIAIQRKHLSLNKWNLVPLRSYRGQRKHRRSVAKVSTSNGDLPRSRLEAKQLTAAVRSLHSGR